MLSSFLTNRGLLLTFLALLAGVLAVGGLIDSANAESTGMQDTLEITAESLAPFAHSQEFARSQDKETVGEDPMVQQMAVDYYTKKYKVTRKEARARIEIQDKASGIEDKISDVLGDNFAGVWYDAGRRGRLQIGLVRSAKGKLSDVRRIVKDYDVSKDTDMAYVRYSISDLEKIRDQISKENQDLILGGRIRIGYNTKANGVRITVADGLNRTEQARLKKITATPGVYVRQSKSKSLKARLNQCAVRKCDPPMRGGREIVRGGRCTTAFVARFSDNVLGVITAGHCVFASGGIDGVWASDNAAGTAHNIGPARKYFFAGALGEDEAMIRIDSGGYWGSPQAVGRVVVKASDDTTYNANYHIHSDSASSLGQILCQTGRTTGTHCGEVDDLGEEISPDLNGVAYTLKNMGELDPCEAEPGDSGGPLYKNKKAYGIHSAVGFNDFADCDEYYQGIRGAQRTMNVSLVFND